MTNPKSTLITALLDRTGSMQNCKLATEDGFNELINSQKLQPGQATVTLAQFDQHVGAPIPEYVYRNKPIAEVPKLTLEPRGMTPLLEATYKFIVGIGEELEALEEAKRPGQVICMIMTDGAENASDREYTWERVNELIKQQTNTYNWKFMFLGANIDAVKVGAKLGMTRGQSITYDSGSEYGTHAVYAAAANAMSHARATDDAVNFSDTDRVESMTKDKAGKKKKK